MITMGIVLALGLYVFELRKLSIEPKEPEAACRKTDIIRVKPGIIDRTEKNGNIVYVTEKWDSVLTGEKDEIGYWLALCQSPDEYVEIRNAKTGEKINEYKIDMHYRMTHGLDVDLPGN